MKVEIPFLSWTRKAALEVEISDDTEGMFWLRAALEVAVKRFANLRGVNLSGAYLSGAGLSGVDLRDVDLRGADLIGADLSGADLSFANLRDADLSGAILLGANLRDANLRGADLLGANLRGADLLGANLRFAIMRGANLRGANLRQGQKASIPPLFVEGLCWPVMVTDCHIMIGCEVHTTDEWAAFDNERIARMDGCSARRFWGQWKKPLLAMARAHQSKVREE
jgi:uncharacterized protein YjbI with pentapeptide repeats